MMVLILFSVLCLFCGVASDTSCLILPHIVVQAVFLLFSVGYFVLYAFSYFYGDLIVHHRSFMVCFRFFEVNHRTLSDSINVRTYVVGQFVTSARCITKLFVFLSDPM